MLQDQMREEHQSALGRQLGRYFSAEYKGVLIAALFMTVIGWGGLVHLVTETRPRIGGEIWFFFILLQIAVTGTAMPLFWLLSIRSADDDGKPAPSAVIARRGVWVGILTVFCAWLLIPRALSFPIFIALILLFAAIEVFLRNRETAHER